MNLNFYRALGEKFDLYVNLNCGIAKSIEKAEGSAKNLKVNDAFYLQNFKGIRNIGYFFDPEGKKVGLGGDILGFDRYISTLIKIEQSENVPFFS